MSRRTGPPAAEMSLEVLAVGPQVLVQDLGRPGHASVGVPRSGAADRSALRFANRIVANAEGAPGLEVLLGGLVLRVLRDVTVAVTGAQGPVSVDGRAVGSGAPLRVRSGSSFAVGTPDAGVRAYVAVRGGITGMDELGSCATDTLTGLGPAPLTVGDQLSVGPAPKRQPVLDVAPVGMPKAGTAVLHAVPGPHDYWLDGGLDGLVAGGWTVSERSDRVGVRLTGARLLHAPEYRTREQPSEGLLRGAVQVPPSGEPVIMLADHPVTGGYPVVAVLVDTDCDRTAQLRPGQPVDLRLVSRRAL